MTALTNITLACMGIYTKVNINQHENKRNTNTKTNLDEQRIAYVEHQAIRNLLSLRN